MHVRFRTTTRRNPVPLQNNNNFSDSGSKQHALKPSECVSRTSLRFELPVRCVMQLHVGNYTVSTLR